MGGGMVVTTPRTGPQNEVVAERSGTVHFTFRCPALVEYSILFWDPCFKGDIATMVQSLDCSWQLVWLGLTHDNVFNLYLVWSKDLKSKNFRIVAPVKPHRGRDLISVSPLLSGGGKCWIDKSAEDADTLRWVENWMNGQAQRVVISGTKLSWRPGTSSVPQGSTVGPILFNIFINDLDDEAGWCTLSMLADDSKLGGVAHMPVGYDAMQRDLNRLKKWAGRNLIKFNKENCKILYLERSNPSPQYMLGADWL
ncbi:rna-directed dna polymerase from mobile element jockey- hypothetical protein [Limosa lapponica baueri]|uniref:Reverse transcriptase domain-containing protein n=1 Tax=Limosa lapponica baueri TaxID=1758121 RepID=A0A2I0TQR1_LIMLA|nr:rna-directed dna polymerase from mobile element jockey- hypothetical protein [Limosa lapponica baueri]